MADLTQESIERMIAAMKENADEAGLSLNVNSTKLLLVPPYNTPEGKKIALRLIIDGLERGGQDATVYRKELDRAVRDLEAAEEEEKMTTPENMIERVARAICAKDDALDTCAGRGGCDDPEGCFRFDQARAAIAAMREPTPEMVTAGMSVAVKPPDWMQPNPLGDASYVHKSFMSRENTAAHFTAMIDQAIKEQP